MQNSVAIASILVCADVKVVNSFSSRQHLFDIAAKSTTSIRIFYRILLGKGLDTCYSATYMSQTRHQQRFTISEVPADWHEPMVPQRIIWPSIARANGQLDPRCS